MSTIELYETESVTERLLECSWAGRDRRASERELLVDASAAHCSSPPPASWSRAGLRRACARQRAYRSAVSHETACHELRRCVGTQFDPAVVDALLRVLEDGGDERKLDTAQTAAGHVRSLLAA
ncbi:MAG TPA: hypothetical protein VEF89_32370 [Solirubrobacteraceae bacterium]|nr:hypothetical protein [Solirubrobacteraceae bacterium]